MYKNKCKVWKHIIFVQISKSTTYKTPNNSIIFFKTVGKNSRFEWKYYKYKPRVQKLLVAYQK